jgi:hypothetical protein
MDYLFIIVDVVRGRASDKEDEGELQYIYIYIIFRSLTTTLTSLTILLRDLEWKKINKFPM